MSLDATPSECMPPPQKCIWSRYDLDLRPLDLLNILSGAHSQVECLCQVSLNISTEYGDSTSWETGVNGETVDGWTHDQ